MQTQKLVPLKRTMQVRAIEGKIVAYPLAPNRFVGAKLGPRRTTSKEEIDTTPAEFTFSNDVVEVPARGGEGKYFARMIRDGSLEPVCDVAKKHAPRH